MAIKNFYTAKEAQARLGMNDNNFYYLVRKGTIKKVVPPGKKQSVYPKSDIDKLASALTTLIDQYDREVSIFEKATVEDMPEEHEMDVSLYGRKTASIEERIARLKMNPESDYVLKNQDEIVGHICFFPVEPKSLEKFLAGEITELPPETMLPFEPGKPLDLLMLVMSIKPGFPPDVAKHYGFRLITGTLEVFKKLGERGIEINNIYATSRTATGIRICRKLGMSVEPMPNETGRFRFQLHVPSSELLLTKGYLQGLSEYKNQHKKATRTKSLTAKLTAKTAKNSVQ